MIPRPSWARSLRIRRRSDEAERDPDEYGMPWTVEFALRSAERPPDAVAAPAPLATPVPTAAGRTLPGDAGFADALRRLCDTFERIADGLEADRHERRMQLDSLERLLRDLIAGIAQPTAVPPIIVGGSIGPEDPEHADPSPRRDLHIDLSESPLDVPRRPRRQ